MTPGQKRHRELKAKAEAYDRLVDRVSALEDKWRHNPEALQNGDHVGVMGGGYRMFLVVSATHNGMVQVVSEGPHELNWRWVPAVTCKLNNTWSEYCRFRNYDGPIRPEVDRFIAKPSRHDPQPDKDDVPL